MYGQLFLLLSCLILSNSAFDIDYLEGHNRRIQNVAHEENPHNFGQGIPGEEHFEKRSLHRVKRQSVTGKANVTTAVPTSPGNPAAGNLTANQTVTKPPALAALTTLSLNTNGTAPNNATTPSPNTTVVPELLSNSTANSTTNATVAPSTTTPVILGSVQIMDINKRNYTFIEHTSFDTGMNGWDFMGLWSKLNLETVEKPFPIPAPKMKTTNSSSGRSTGAGDVTAAARGLMAGKLPVTMTPPPPQLMPDDNNFAFISYVSRVPGILYKSFSSLSDGAVFVTYYVKEPTVNFTISLTNNEQTVYTLFDFSLNGTANNTWVTQDCNFTRQQTNSLPFKINVFVTGPPPSNSTDKRVWVALHHIAIGGAMLPLPPTTTPAPTIDPLGALANIKKISDSIWIALYVFLFFFLLAITALVFLIVRGRCR